MKTISTAEARKRFAKITEEVRLEKTTYVIVRYGKEIARLTPPHTKMTPRIRPELKKELSSLFERYDEALKTLANR